MNFIVTGRKRLLQELDNRRPQIRTDFLLRLLPKPAAKLSPKRSASLRPPPTPETRKTGTVPITAPVTNPGPALPEGPVHTPNPIPAADAVPVPKAPIVKPAPSRCYITLDELEVCRMELNNLLASLTSNPSPAPNVLIPQMVQSPQNLSLGPPSTRNHYNLPFLDLGKFDGTVYAYPGWKERVKIAVLDRMDLPEVVKLQYTVDRLEYDVIPSYVRDPTNRKVYKLREQMANLIQVREETERYRANFRSNQQQQQPTQYPQRSQYPRKSEPQQKAQTNPIQFIPQLLL
uniref:Uncharacterized protein n=1 Tax=Acrobeloides nanus TaxID=290746 RepID=A0A914CWE8_9BILA